MAASQGDLIQVTDEQTYLGQTVLNVFYYRVIPITGITGDYLQAIHDQWATDVLDKILAIQRDLLVHTTCHWKNLSNGVDFKDITVNLPGDVNPGGGLAGCMPSYVSAGFLLRRSSLTTRNGYKRFAGMEEANISGNTWSAALTAPNAIATALAMDITLGIVPTVEPVIVKRPIASPAGAYLYSSIDEAVFRGIGTQNTRKAGRGI